MPDFRSEADAALSRLMRGALSRECETTTIDFKRIRRVPAIWNG
jgi:hypothetical protein